MCVILHTYSNKYHTLYVNINSVCKNIHATNYGIDLEVEYLL